MKQDTKQSSKWKFCWLKGKGICIPEEVLALGSASILHCRFSLPETSWIGTRASSAYSVLSISLSRHASITMLSEHVYAFSSVFAVLLLGAQNIPNCCQTNLFTQEVLYRNNLLLGRWFCYALQGFPWVKIFLCTWEDSLDGSKWLVFLEKSLKRIQLKCVRLICYEEYTQINRALLEMEHLVVTTG